MVLAMDLPPNKQQFAIRNIVQLPGETLSLRIIPEWIEDATQGLQNRSRYAFSVYQTGDQFQQHPQLQEPSPQTLTDWTKTMLHQMSCVVKKVSWRKFQLLYKQNREFASSSNHPGGNNQRLMPMQKFYYARGMWKWKHPISLPAVGYLNQVPRPPKCSMPLYPTAQFPVGTKDQVTKAIMHERMVELGCEDCGM